MTNEMTAARNRRLFLLLGDWTWWTWFATAILLLVGLCGRPEAFLVAMGVTAVQGTVMLLREKRVWAFPVQLRIAYLALLGICYLPHMTWLYWLPMVGTFALVFFGYCLLARVLSLLPWNRRESLSAELLWRTFVSRPDLARVTRNQAAGCAGGLCTIDAQVARRSSTPG